MSPNSMFSRYDVQDYVRSLFTGSMAYVRTAVMRKDDNINCEIYMHVRDERMHLDDDLYTECRKAYDRENDRLRREERAEKSAKAAQRGGWNLGNALDEAISMGIAKEIGERLAVSLIDEMRKEAAA